MIAADQNEAIRAATERLERFSTIFDAEHAAVLRANPAFIPRNHRIEEMIVAATVGDFAPFETMVSVLARPYEDQPAHGHLAEPPAPEERVRATFCGT